MTLSQLFLLVLIAGMCGSIAQAISGYSRGGCLVSITLGFVGAVLGSWLAQLSGLGEILAVQVGGQSFPIVWSIIGAALFVALLNLLNRRQPE
jgi:uncharacterized membrane protein YeaQ/YmgE (transglycosylase-associated protein family)